MEHEKLKWVYMGLLAVVVLLVLWYMYKWMWGSDTKGEGPMSDLVTRIQNRMYKKK